MSQAKDGSSSPKKQLAIAKQKIPPPCLQLQLEIEAYERIIRKLEKEKKNAGDEAQISINWNEVATRKVLYDTLMGKSYVTPPELARSQKNALVKMYLALHGHAWSRKNGWIGQPKILKKPEVLLFEAESSVFEGVEVLDVGIGQKTSYVVSSLRLEGVGCTGMLPDEICDLMQLQNLHLNDNLISGPLPRKFSQLQSLKRLCLNNNMIECPLDSSTFARCQDMVIIDLSCNRFSGRILNTEAMSQLSILNLANNRFSGEIPDALAGLKRLRTLKLNGNYLEGTIPFWMADLQQLKEINLSHNRLEGGVDVLLSLARLEILLLDNNRLGDNILVSSSSGIELPWSQLSRLRILYMHKNRLVGSFPAQLAMIKTLRFLNLSHNDIEGVLPDNIGDLISLRSLLLAGNRIVGPVPLSLANLKSLKDFDVFKPYPAAHTEPPRGFIRRKFERIYEYGPRAHMNSVNWDTTLLYGPNARIHTPMSILRNHGSRSSGHDSESIGGSLASDMHSLSATVATAERYENSAH